jgi:hypothetical protein
MLTGSPGTGVATICAESGEAASIASNEAIEIADHDAFRFKMLIRPP